MSRRHHSWLLLLLLPYLTLAVGSGFLHHHDAEVGAADRGSQMTAAGDSFCAACQWLVSSAGIGMDAEAAVAAAVVRLPRAEPSESHSQRVQLPPSRAPPSV